MDYWDLGSSVNMNTKKQSLGFRQKLERSFHDNLAKNEFTGELNFKQYFLAETALENKFSLFFLKPLKGKRILDLGCGNGEASLFFASKGAFVEAIDISPNMIANVRKLTQKYHLGARLNAHAMVAEKLQFPPEAFDFIYGCGILHHSDMNLVLQQSSAVLKKEGLALFIEPLEHNPLIHIYRLFSKNVHTPTEKPLEYDQIKEMTKFGFRDVEHREFQLSTLLIFVWMYVFEKASPNKTRYWKKIILDSEKYERIFLLLHKFDNWCLRLFPFLRRYCWNTVIILKK